MSRPAHAAFPAANPPPITPSNPRALSDLLNHYRDPEQIHQILIPTLIKIANGDEQPGRSIRDKKRAGEDLLTVDDWDLSRFNDNDIIESTGALVFIL
jgi:hypothetical protein